MQSHLPRRSIRALFQHGVLDSAANSVINLEVIFVTGHSAKIFGLVRSGPERGLVFDISVSEGAAMDNRNEKGTRFRVEKLEERIAPTIVQVNGGGNIPNGEANGVPASNPAGYEPPGWNK